MSSVAALACEPRLDVGTWLGSTANPPPSPTPSPTPTEPSPTGTAPTPSLDAGPSPAPDASAPVEPPELDAGPDSGVEAGVDLDSGLDAGPVSPPDSGVSCSFPPDPDNLLDAGPLLEWTAPVALPWTTSFENGFCDFPRESGYCYASPDAVYETVSTESRTGMSAASFSVATADTLDGPQSRCVRRGVLPRAAYYSAWYFIPTPVRTTSNWNLFHFRGFSDTESHGLWDVSLRTNAADGELYLYVLEQITGGIHEPAGAPVVPIGTWFHLQVYLERAADMTGEFAVYQDGQLVFQRVDVVTDDTELGAWYFGNLAEELVPQNFTIYMDDVSIGLEP